MYCYLFSLLFLFPLFPDIEVTRPYTFSYFPEIAKKKKKVGNSDAEKKKSRKISKVEIKTSMSWNCTKNCTILLTRNSGIVCFFQYSSCSYSSYKFIRHLPQPTLSTTVETCWVTKRLVKPVNSWMTDKQDRRKEHQLYDVTSQQLYCQFSYLLYVSATYQ